MARPSVLAAFCGVGGDSVGWDAAGFTVRGVDHSLQPDYPFTSHLGDAVSFIYSSGRHFDLITAGPPCQHDNMLTAGTNAGRFDYPDLLIPTLRALQWTGRPWVLEQPPGLATARMRDLVGQPDLTLCGEMFGLGVLRHRNFWLSGVRVPKPAHKPHRGRVAGMRHGEWFEGPYFAVYGEGGGKGTVAQWQKAMGIDWTENRKSIAEAIPPAYAQFIGSHVLPQLKVGT
jgi:hypothetical protein